MVEEVNKRSKAARSLFSDNQPSNGGRIADDAPAVNVEPKDLLLPQNSPIAPPLSPNPEPILSQKAPMTTQRRTATESSSSFTPPPPPSQNTSINRIRVWRRESKDPAMKQIKIVSRDSESFFLRFKSKNWRKDLEDAFASDTMVSVNSAESSRQFSNLLLTTRREMDADASMPSEERMVVEKEESGAFRRPWVELYRPSRYTDLLSE